MSMSMNCPVYEMSCRWNVLSMKCPVYEMSCLWNVNVYEMSCVWNVHVYEMTCLWNGLSMKWHAYEMSLMKWPVYEMSRQAEIKTYSKFMNFISQLSECFASRKEHYLSLFNTILYLNCKNKKKEQTNFFLI